VLRLLDSLFLTLTRRGSWARGRIAYRALAAVVVAERNPRER
jgi:hypothetical protein